MPSQKSKFAAPCLPGYTYSCPNVSCYCLLFSEAPLSWAEANNFCANKGTSLPIILSEDEWFDFHSIHMNTAPSIKNVWIGLKW